MENDEFAQFVLLHFKPWRESVGELLTDRVTAPNIGPDDVGVTITLARLRDDSDAIVSWEERWSTCAATVVAVHPGGATDIRYNSWNDALKAWKLEDRLRSSDAWKVDPRDGVIKHPYLEHLLLAFSGEDRARRMARELRELGTSPGGRGNLNSQAVFTDIEERARLDDYENAVNDSRVLGSLELAYANYKEKPSDSKAFRREAEIITAFRYVAISSETLGPLCKRVSAYHCQSYGAPALTIDHAAYSLAATTRFARTSTSIKPSRAERRPLRLLYLLALRQS